MTQLKFELRSSGYCTSHQHYALRGTAKKEIRFYATWAYLHHPIHGHILFDTGYTKRFFEETKNYSAKIYALATPTFISDEEEAHFQLNQKGIRPADINYIIISHFHADHICGLRDFPNAIFVCEKKAYLDVKNASGIPATRRAFLPGLMPDDFVERMKLIEINKGKKEDANLGKLIDLFEDGTIQLCDFSGHAKGQIGALLNTEKGQILMAADAAWVKENYQNMHLPSSLVRLFFHSWSDFKKSLSNLNQFHINNPQVVIIPCHCLETYEKYKVQNT